MERAEVGSQWGPVNPKPRLDLLAALEPAGERATVPRLAKILDKHPATIQQMLDALLIDELVDFAVEEENKRRRVWWRTELPIPEKFTSTADVYKPADVFDDRELRAVLGVPLSPPRIPGRTTFHKL